MKLSLEYANPLWYLSQAHILTDATGGDKEQSRDRLEDNDPASAKVKDNTITIGTLCNKRLI